MLSTLRPGSQSVVCATHLSGTYNTLTARRTMQKKSHESIFLSVKSVMIIYNERSRPNLGYVAVLLSLIMLGTYDYQMLGARSTDIPIWQPQLCLLILSFPIIAVPCVQVSCSTMYMTVREMYVCQQWLM